MLTECSFFLLRQLLDYAALFNRFFAATKKAANTVTHGHIFGCSMARHKIGQLVVAKRGGKNNKKRKSKGLNDCVCACPVLKQKNKLTKILPRQDYIKMVL